MKKLLIFSIVVCMLTMCIPVAMANTDSFKVSGKVDFDKSLLTVTIETPATYGQNILVTLYPKDTVVTSPDSYIRLGETFASRDGVATITFDLSNSVKLGHYTISASGGGYMAATSHDTEDIYFETVSDINNITLPAVSSAEGDELEKQLEKLNNYFGLEVCGEFETEKTDYLKYFEDIRSDLYPEGLTSFEKVQNVADGVEIIFETLKATKQSDIQELYEENSELLGFDTNDDDYKKNIKSIYSIFLGLVKDNKESLENISDLKLWFKQAIGMSVINTKNAKTVTDVVKKYGESLGITVKDYTSYVNERGETLFNLNFVGRDFTKPADVVAAYKAAIKATEPEGDNGGGLKREEGGGGGGGISRPANNNTTTPAPEEKPLFNDMDEKHWAYSFVKALSDAKVISGFEDGSFRPDDKITREQFVKMIVEICGAYTIDSKIAFGDIPSGHWAAGYITSAVDNGIIKGISEDLFGLGKTLTRQDAAVIIVRAADKFGFKLADSVNCEFTDSDSFAEYAAESINRLAASGIISGFEDSTFKADESLTRCQCAKMLCGLLGSR